jgi:hypothetical protein
MEDDNKLPDQMFFGHLHADLPPQITKGAMRHPSSVIEAEEIFMVAVGTFPEIQLSSSHLILQDKNPIAWKADFMTIAEPEAKSITVNVPVLKIGCVISVEIKLIPDARQTEKKKKEGPTKKIDGVAVNFVGIPTMITTKEEAVILFRFDEKTIFKLMLNLYQVAGLDGKIHTLSRGTMRVIFFKAKLPEVFKNNSGSVEVVFYSKIFHVRFFKDKRKSNEEADKDILAKRQKLLEDAKAKSSPQPAKEDGNSEC